MNRHNNKKETFARVMLNAELVHGDRAQDFAARIDFNDYERALAQLRAAMPSLSRTKGSCLCQNRRLRSKARAGECSNGMTIEEIALR